MYPKIYAGIIISPDDTDEYIQEITASLRDDVLAQLDAAGITPESGGRLTIERIPMHLNRGVTSDTAIVNPDEGLLSHWLLWIFYTPKVIQS